MTVKPLPNVAYKVLLCSGPLILVRLPLKGRPGRRDYTVRWREIVKAAGAVLREHGLRGKDLRNLEHHVDADDWDPDTDPDTAYPSKVPLAERIAGALRTALRADAAFAGSGEIMPTFYLYDWRGGRFELVRRPTVMDEREFEWVVGSLPENDDLERANCPEAGQPGHRQCGVCEWCSRLRFLCVCAPEDR